MTGFSSAWLRRSLSATILAGCVGFAFMASAHVASAADAIDCETTEDDAALLTCAKKDLDVSQHHMDQLVATTLKSLPAAARPIFDASQKAWTAYRDADCKWNAYDTDSGKSSDLIMMNCLADLTISRLEELEAGTGAN